MANSKPKVMHGARAIMAVAGQPVGLFTNVSYHVQYDVAPVNILGRYGPVTTEYVGAEPVQVNCNGWRVLDHGPFAVIGKNGERLVPTLNELITAEEITLTIYDRQDPTKKVMEVVGCRSQGFQGGMASRSLSEMSVSFIGLVLTDENAPSQGEPGAPDLV